MSHADFTETPEFVRWAIARPCALRDQPRWPDPECAERQLRPLRAYSEAAGEGRLLEGICVAADAGETAQPPQGFRASEIFAAYQGQAGVAAACNACPANAVRTNGSQSLAGCFGLFELSVVGEQLHSLVDGSLQQLGLASEIRSEFIGTRPTWYGLWAASPLNTAQVRLHAQLADALSARDERLAALLRDWRLALQAATTCQLPLHVTYAPRGRIEGATWFVPAHCSRCKAESPARSGRCPVCGHEAIVQPRRRRVKGSRPYLSLETFLGPQAALEFFARYGEHRLRNLRPPNS